MPGSSTAIYEVEECEYCGSTVASSWMAQHHENCGEADRIDSLLEAYDGAFDDAPFHVYILLLECEERPMFYVGMTSDIQRRMTFYIREYADITFPSSGTLVRGEYRTLGVQRTIPVHGDKSQAMYEERKVFCQLASEVGVDMVAGGR